MPSVPTVKRGPGRPRQSHCKYGHPYSGDNLYIETDGSRGCRACAASRHARWRAANPERWRAILGAARERDRVRRIKLKHLPA